MDEYEDCDDFDEPEPTDEEIELLSAFADVFQSLQPWLSVNCPNADVETFLERVPVAA